MSRTNTYMDPDFTGASTTWTAGTNTANFGGIWLNGRWFPPIMGGAEDADGTAGTEGAGDAGSTEGANSGDASDGSGDGSTSDDEPKLTQAQVDAIVTREKAKAARGKIDPKELGFESAKEAANFIAEAKKQQAENMEEGEKLFQEAVEEAKSEAKAEVLDKANMRLVRAEFILAASKSGVAFADDAFDLVQKLDAWGSVEIDDDGNVTGIDKALFDDLKKAKPYLFTDFTPNGGDIGAGRRSTGSDDKMRIADLSQKYPALGQSGKRRAL